MIGPLCFVLAVLASPFKSKLRLEAENAVINPDKVFGTHQIVSLALAICWPLLNPRLCATIILSANYLYLLTPPTSPSGRFANPAVINLSIRSSRSLLVHSGRFSSLASSTFDAFFCDIAA
jgi:hypothetical protein